MAGDNQVSPAPDGLKKAAPQEAGAKDEKGQKSIP
jgi:hypothetical protein